MLGMQSAAQFYIVLMAAATESIVVAAVRIRAPIKSFLNPRIEILWEFYMVMVTISSSSRLLFLACFVGKQVEEKKKGNCDAAVAAASASASASSS